MASNASTFFIMSHKKHTVDLIKFPFTCAPDSGPSNQYTWWNQATHHQLYLGRDNIDWRFSIICISVLEKILPSCKVNIETRITAMKNPKNDYYNVAKIKVKILRYFKISAFLKLCAVCLWNTPLNIYTLKTLTV